MLIFLSTLNLTLILCIIDKKIASRVCNLFYEIKKKGLPSKMYEKTGVTSKLSLLDMITYSVKLCNNTLQNYHFVLSVQ